MTDLEHALRTSVQGDVLFDRLTRRIYSTDASIYSIEPIGVVCPRNADDVVAVVDVAKRFGVPVLPRGAGTSLAGQTVGKAVVLDFSRHMHSLIGIDAESRTARVQPGLVQDDLNAAAAKHGLMFAPDTSTANRATLGGMVGNNSCGSRSARYGMTVDHLDSLQVVLSDGSRVTLGAVTPDLVTQRARGDSLEARLYRAVPELVQRRESSIRNDFPPYWRKSGGYRLERLLPERGAFDLSKVVVGSEGTLAITTEATVRLVPVPRAVASVAGHFESVAAALAAVDDALDAGAAAIELVDRTILNLARLSPLHAHVVSALTGDPGALLFVEFYGETPAEASGAARALEERWQRGRHGYAIARAGTPAELKRFREVRRAGLGLLSAAGKGNERSIAFIEDTAVDPRSLAAYTADLAKVLDRHGLRAGFYGHASAGCLHIRPFMDLGRPSEVAMLRAVAEEVASLVQQYGGMNSSEHGDGLVRAEFSRRLFGDDLYEAMRELKRAFDPDNRLNPGKKVDSPSMTDSLREPGLPRALPVATQFPFAYDDGMRGAANRCVRVGACRKSAAAGPMCPSFMATKDERHSTRGRANALVDALSSPDPRAALGDDALMEVLDLCLECKACKAECPMSVDMATLKSEALYHRYAQRGTPLSARFFGNARRVNQLGSRFALLANVVNRSRILRSIAERAVGVDRRRPLPVFPWRSLGDWFRRRTPQGSGKRGDVVFFGDSFTSFTEPGIGIASIELLERAGWRVILVDDVCCGRSQISKGLLDAARARHAPLLDRLAPFALAGVPIVGCEPSCVFTLKDELVSLSRGDERALAIARQARLVEELLVEAIDDGSLSWPEDSVPTRTIVLHGHCHQKAAHAMSPTVKLLERIPGAELTVLDAGCCGMAGSFGFERNHYELSMQIGEQRLFPAVRSAPGDAWIAATGVSCRQQITHGTGRSAVHPVVLLHQLLEATSERSAVDSKS